MTTIHQVEMTVLFTALADAMTTTGKPLSAIVDDELLEEKLVQHGISPERAEQIIDATYTAFDDLTSLEQDVDADDEDVPDDNDEDPIEHLGLNEYNQLPSEVAEETRRQTIEDETDGNVDD